MLYACPQQHDKKQSTIQTGKKKPTPKTKQPNNENNPIKKPPKKKQANTLVNNVVNPDFRTLEGLFTTTARIPVTEIFV